MFSAAWAWLVLTVGVTFYVVAFDLFAYYSGARMMTIQFRLWLFDPVTGPFIAAGVVRSVYRPDLPLVSPQAMTIPGPATARQWGRATAGKVRAAQRKHR